jgi:tellurite resistance protein TehA-like permease
MIVTIALGVVLGLFVWHVVLPIVIVAIVTPGAPKPQKSGWRHLLWVPVAFVAFGLWLASRI